MVSKISCQKKDEDLRALDIRVSILNIMGSGSLFTLTKGMVQAAAVYRPDLHKTLTLALLKFTGK